MRKASCWLLAIASACTPAMLIPGRYAETPPPGAIPYVGQAVELQANHTFSYYRWSDDLASNRYGAGRYQLNGREVQLVFAAQQPIAAQAQAQTLNTTPDSLRFVFLIETLGTPLAPAESIAFASVTAYDAAGRPLVTTVSNGAGLARLCLPAQAPLALFRATSLGFLAWQQAAPDSSTCYRVQLPANRGAAYPAGTTKTFQVRQLGGQPTLEAGPGQPPLRRQPTAMRP